jgi:hypothetical protein
MRKKRMLRALAAVGAASSLLWTAPPWSPFAGLHARPALAAATVAADEPTASADAESSGTAVEALSDRTDYAQVFANPDGSFTYDASPVIQRFQQADGTWTSINTTLQQRSDGSVVPAATPAGLVLSGGGTGALLTVGQGSQTLSLTWPGGSLPAPTVSGDTATYPSVLTGVDLVVTATPDGVRESLVVNNAQAASNPALSNLKFNVAGSGLTLSSDSDGGMTASDPFSGSALFDIPVPEMWDASGGGSTATAAGAVANVATMPMTLTNKQMTTRTLSSGATTTDTTTTLAMSPSSSLLTSSSTVYPVTIDPEVSVHGANSWLDAATDTNGAAWGDWEPSSARSGAVCDTNLAPCPSGIRFVAYRSYFNFSVPHQIWDSDRISATLFTNETWSWSCTKTAVQLWQTTFASRGATWAHQPAQQQQQDSQTVAFGNNSSCAPHGVSFNASGAATAAASNHWNTLTLELRAASGDESSWNPASWKIFHVSASQDPFLQITYNHKPSAPAFPETLNNSASIGCGSPSSPLWWISATQPTLSAVFSDPDGTSVTPTFRVSNSSGTVIDTQTAPALASGTRNQVQVTSGKLTDGTYTWNASGSDGQLTGPNSPTCAFGLDTTAPATPTITSSNYTSGPPATNGIGVIGHFTFTDSNNSDPLDGTNDVVGYRYGFSDPPLGFVGADSTKAGNPATVDVSPVTLGTQTLSVRAMDRAGNLSPSVTFDVETNRTGNPTPLLAWLPFSEGSGTSAGDFTGDGHIATLGSQAGWGAGRTSGSSALSLSGASDSEASTQATLPPLNNKSDFTVSAWVNLSPACANSPSTCGFYDAVALDGNVNSAFSLQYTDQAWCGAGDGDGVNGCWTFALPSADTPNASVTNVEASTAVVFNKWVHLVGVYDATHQQAAIYVDGQLKSAWVPTGQVWAAQAVGSLRVGRELSNGGPWNWWPGEVSDVCIFFGALEPNQIQNVHDKGCQNAGAPAT